jgi:hypothetical protein
LSWDHFVVGRRTNVKRTRATRAASSNETLTVAKVGLATGWSTGRYLFLLSSLRLLPMVSRGWDVLPR